MDTLIALFSSPAMDAEIVSGISYAFALIFFGPLLVVTVVFFVYCLLARKSALRPARILSVLWLIACLPAALLITMGYAFNSAKMNPLLSIPLWVVSGLVFIWLPVALRALVRRRPI